ncbi:FadR/GntR family transcriptional regulator [Hyphomonas oceanitis]|uniref:Regulatory protein GntR n=1 Tax=Hyphomonas oceanitis SCH89 TaxID=1280953 RepID=A0A059G4K7_9PROT|nr:GntR family transcriptional regulator [Hyphomonas oceanitis]KDA01751.1 regulatory protein GntR [Hyphomonas oceanitis SCH89]|tara:strand:- start:2548 stop:3360 length:813 start_codon:yes stop_codon:yes gene_type:complete
MTTKSTMTREDLRPNGGAQQRIRTPKTSEVVADKIRGQIVRGELTEGDTLPPEGQLMETLGVSRPTLREAYRILEAENLISVTRGSRSGAQVHRPRAEVASRYAGYVLQSQGTTIADLYASQMALEPYVVRTLCQMRNNTDAVAALSEHLEYLLSLVDGSRIEAFTRGVADFHLLLVKLAGNQTLTFINQMLLDLMANHKTDVMRRDPIDPETRKKRLLGGMKSYRKLIQLIEAHEEEAAVAHWRLHLKNAHARWAGPGEGERVVDALNV